MKRRVNYLGNRELLAEIHKSKITFCSFLDDEAGEYDLILKLDEDFLPEHIDMAAKNRADRMTKRMRDELKMEGATQAKVSAAVVLPEDIDVTTLVIRKMTYDHIPIDTERTRKATKIADKHVKLNFPPFKHFRVDGKRNLIEAGRSHWEGGLTNGYFNRDHGVLTNKLAKQFMLLVERYSQKGNWRGYTYLEDMRGQALVQLTDAALKFDESVSDNPFSYYTMIVTNCFRGVLNSEERVSDIKSKIMTDQGFDESFSKQIDREMD